MNNIRPVFHRPAACFLLLLILCSGAGRLVHLLADAHHHEEQRVCSIDDNDGKVHLHDAHFLSEDCQLCDYVVQSSLVPEWPAIVRYAHSPLAFAALSEGESFQLVRTLSANLLRGPPAFSHLI